MMEFRGNSCILYVHKHRATSPRDDECEHAVVKISYVFVFG